MRSDVCLSSMVTSALKEGVVIQTNMRITQEGGPSAKQGGGAQKNPDKPTP